MYTDIYNLWLKNATADPDLTEELKSIEGKSEEISDRFYRELEFGTAGLRGVIGAGTNRMNRYTVAKATQGLAEYVKSVNEHGSVAIAYDSRIKSEYFAKVTASVFAANGIKVYIYKELMPTPMLSFAVRHFGCDVGVVITASHNPAKYNGYKAYGPDGCQLTPDAADKATEVIEKLDIFNDVKFTDFDEAVKNGTIEYIGEDTIEAYLDAVMLRSEADNIDFSDFKVIFTPLHGTGNKPVRAILDKIGVKNVTVVPEQELPDGNFPTVDFPNPEFRKAFECALKLAKEISPDILLATDPDADRVGAAVKLGDDYELITGNEMGVLLLDYILRRKAEKGTMPNEPVAVKSIVSTELANKVAESHGCRLIDVLTGFKFIGEQIAILEEKGEENRFVFGFEESYGYLAGTYVRDKDAVVASMLICEMAAYYKAKGLTLLDVLDELGEKFGYFMNMQKSVSFEGQSGMAKIKAITESARSNPPESIAGTEVVAVADYLASLRKTADGKTEAIELPKADVIKFELSDGSSVIVRPSGTEPKVKFYISVKGDTKADAKSKLELINNSVNENGFC